MNNAQVLARFGDFHLDEANAQLQCASRAIDLQPKELAVLCELARHAGRLVTKNQLLDAIWGHQHVSESVLKTIVSRLRAVLDDDAREPRCIETVSRKGYRFIAAVAPSTSLAAFGAPIAPSALGDDTSPTAFDATAAPSRLDPAPPAPAIEAQPLVVGRDAALACLQDKLDAARTCRRQLMFVAGEAGIGKTTLIDAFASTAVAQGAVCARGQCVEHHGAAEPYLPFLEAIDMLVRADPQRLALLRRAAPSWLAQMPWHLADDEERRELQREVAGITQERMLREIGELLDRLTERQPLVLVLEDLHWSDHASVQLIGYLARRRSPAALLVLASLRPADVIAESHPIASLRRELRVQRLADEVDLEAFSEADIGTLLERRLNVPAAALPEAFVQALHDHTGGLPLFVANMLDELTACGALRRDEGDAPPCRSPETGDCSPGHRAWRFPDASALTVPARIADVLAVRLARMPDTTRRALAAASVAGTEFLHLPLAAAMQVDADELQAQLDAEAARGRWLRAAGVATLPGGRVAARYAFRHGLYRHVLYDALSPLERVRWHRALGAAIEALHREEEGMADAGAAGSVAGELALHFERGHMPLAAMRQFVHVARRALLRGAPHEALQAARRGLALARTCAAGREADALLDEAAPGNSSGDATAAAESELDLRVLEGVGLSRIHVLVQPEVAQAFERTRALCAQVPASPARTRAQHGLWWVSFGRGDLVEAQRLAQELLDAASTIGGANLALVGASTMGLTRSLRGDFRAARAHLEQAIEISERVGDRLDPGVFVQDPAVEARSHLAVLSWWLGEPATARRHAAAAVARATAIRHPLSRIVALHYAAALHCFAGEMVEARACTGQLFEVIRTHGLPDLPGTFSWLHGRAMVECGEVDAGLAVMREAEESCRRTGLMIGITGYHYHLAEAYRSAGQIDEALASAERGLALAQQGPEKYLLSALHRVRAELLHASGGDPAFAGNAMAAALDAARQQGARFFELAALVAGMRLSRSPEGTRGGARSRLGDLFERHGASAVAKSAR